MTGFEREQLSKTNLRFLWGLALHIPLSLVVALAFGNSLMVALIVSLLLVGGGSALYAAQRDSLATSIGLAVATMGFSALWIHLGRGMIEMHFHVFASLAILAVFGSYWPVLAAVGTIAIHHLGFWMFLPESVFNYQASIGIVLLHAAFVLMEAVPACWIAGKLNAATRAQGIARERLRGAADNLTSVASTIAGSTQALAATASLQSASLTQTSALDEHMRSLSKSGESLASAITLMTEISEGARSIHQAVDRTSSSMEAITQSSRKVAGILRVIDEIAFQTNIIALNAAVEAARAGAAGAGFAVVADEVRTLAHRCADAAKETAALIEASLSNIEQGNEAVKRVSTGVTAISTHTNSVADIVAEVQNVSQSHGESIARLSEVVSQVKSVIDRLAASAEGNANAGSTLTQQATDMQELVKLIAAGTEA